MVAGISATIASGSAQLPLTGSAGAWIVQGLKQFLVERGVRVEAASSVTGAAASRIGEPSPCFLNQEDPRCMVPFEVALSEEPVYLASDDFDQWQRARRWAESNRKLTLCWAIKSVDRCVVDRRGQAHGKATSGRSLVLDSGPS